MPSLTSSFGLGPPRIPGQAFQFARRVGTAPGVLWGAMILSACTTHAVAGGLPDAFSYSFSQSGGFAGMARTLRVESDGAASFQTGRLPGAQNGRLSAADLQALRRALEDSDFARWGGPFRCSGCADQFSYSVTLTTAGKAHRVSWEDMSKAPESLDKLGAVSLRLMSDYFVRPVR